jgi:uncharacterized protein
MRAMSEYDVPISDSLVDEFMMSVANDRLHLILLPTERCNFRCTYCYEDFAIGRMNAATIAGVKRLVERRLDELHSLTISWFGGEPLLARTVVEDISEYIVHAIGERRYINYNADITTNGYLLDSATVSRLAGLGICLFQISLDGPQPFHDQTRIRADGKGSFNRIWRNLLAIRDGTADVHVMLRIHLTPANLSSMREFLIHIRDTFLGDTRFSVLLKPVERLGGPNDDSMEILSHEVRPRILAELEALVVEGGDARRIYPAPSVCYASHSNSLMIRANGLVGKCTVALTDPVNTIGRLLPDGLLIIDNQRLRPWLGGWESRDPSALECPYNSLRDDSPQLLQIGRRPPGPFVSTALRWRSSW